jgi:hypothetical protein
MLAGNSTRIRSAKWDHFFSWNAFLLSDFQSNALAVSNSLRLVLPARFILKRARIHFWWQ